MIESKFSQVLPKLETPPEAVVTRFYYIRYIRGQRNLIHYWLDASDKKNTSTVEKFLSLIEKKTQALRKKVEKTLIDFSFYMVDWDEEKVYRLFIPVEKKVGKLGIKMKDMNDALKEADNNENNIYDLMDKFSKIQWPNDFTLK